MLIDPSLCDCGSGLRSSRCCGLDFHTLPPPGSARHLLPLVEQAGQALRIGDAGTAEQLALEVLELAPGQPGALEILYRVRAAQNQAKAAEALLRRYVALHPNEPALTGELALLLMQRAIWPPPSSTPATASASHPPTPSRTT